VCVVSRQQNLSSFDGDGGNRGILEVKFEVIRRVQSQINVWYGEDPRRRKLRLLQRDEEKNGLGPGVYIRHFTPDDACYGDFPALGDCRNKCGKTDDAAFCYTNFSKAPISIAAEGCTGEVKDGAVRLISVIHLDAPCVCRDSTNCLSDSRVACMPLNGSPGLPHSTCPANNPRCASACVKPGCTGEGETCVVTHNGKMCTSRIACQEGRPVCPNSGCL
jgi:hypothetical protein